MFKELTDDHTAKKFQEFCGTQKFYNILISALNQINPV
jgi:hypothetical protein